MLRSWLHQLAAHAVEARPLLPLKKRMDGKQPRSGARYVDRGCAVRQGPDLEIELAVNNVGADG